MKNPRGYFLMGLFMAAFVLFAMGPVQGNPKVSQKGTYVYSMNSPPGQIVIAVIETPSFQVTVEPVVYIQVARGVSVPIRGLIVRVNNVNYETQSYQAVSNVTDNRSLYQRATLNNTTLKELIASSKANYLRGVNTRLDIGENYNFRV